MSKTTASRLCLFLGAIVLLSLNVMSQTQAPPVSRGTADDQFTLKTGTEVVLVNVTVRDKNGMFIKNLKADDFTVLEDGKKQTITSIDAENTDTVVTAETPKTPVLRSLTSTPASPSPAPAPVPLQENDLKDRRLIVLFFDLGSMQPQEVERSATSALDYIEKQMAPADLVAVVTLSNSLSVAQDFTSNKQQLTTILTALETGSNEGLGDAAAADTTGDNTDTSTDAAAAFTPDETEYNIFNTDRRLQALTSIANDLTGIQQRKSVIYFAGGLQRTGMENQTQLRIAINAATRANLSFYTVDVRGLEAIIPGGAAGGTGQRAGAGGRSVGGSNAYSGRGMLSQLDTNFATQETLVTLANDTGGKAFLDTNDFTPAFTKVQEDTSSYYLLGYVSNNPARDGRYRQISIRLNRADLKDAKLEYRRGYYAPADFQHSTKETREQQLQDELTSDLPSNDFPVYVSTGYFRLGDNRYFVPVSVVVPGSQIPFTRASEEDRATLDLIGIVRDEGKRPFGQLRDTVKFNVNTSQEIQRKNVQYDGAFLLPPGKYTVKFVIRENQTGRMGSFETSLVVPDLKTDPVKVSSIVVSNQKQAAKAKNNPLVREGSEIVPNVTRVFSSNQHLFLYYEVYDPAKPEEAPGKSAARILTNVSFYRGAAKVYETPVVEGDQVNVPERKAAGFELDLPLADLKPGFYTCQVNVIDDAAGKFVFPRLGLLVR